MRKNVCVISTSSILVAEIGKPPNIAEAHRHGDAGEEEVQLVAPLASLSVAVLITEMLTFQQILNLTDWTGPPALC